MHILETIILCSLGTSNMSKDPHRPASGLSSDRFYRSGQHGKYFFENSLCKASEIWRKNVSQINYKYLHEHVLSFQNSDYISEEILTFKEKVETTDQAIDVFMDLLSSFRNCLCHKSSPIKNWHEIPRRTQ